MNAGAGTELGQRHFQHPRRATGDFGPNIDRFSFILIDLSLRALIERPQLFDRHSNGENILFSANDLLDPRQSAVFSDVKGITTLAKEVDNFASVCAAPVANVPSLSDFLAGKNIPSNLIVISTIKPQAPAGQPTAQAAAYIGAYQVVDATNFSAVMGLRGDRIELVGRIAVVQAGKTRYNRPYAFLMFGLKKLNIVRVTIWSDGLEKLAAHHLTPDKSWAGQWVSVTGLVDSEYTYKKVGNTHVGITIRDTTQLRKITEAQALHRLRTARTGGQAIQPSPATSRNAGVLAAIGVHQPPPGGAPLGGPTGASTSRNAAILKGLQSPAPSTTTPSSITSPIVRRPRPYGSPPPPLPSPPPQPPKEKKGIPAWVWWVVGIIVLWLMLTSKR
jgi:hypothetical protein